MARAALRFEEAGGQRLPLGGRNGYLGVRGGQGRKKDKFQGTTPKKTHRTGHHDTALEAAIAFAQMEEDLDLGIHAERGEKSRRRLPAQTPRRRWTSACISAACCSSSGPMSCAYGVCC